MADTDSSERQIVPYLIPMLGFMGLTALEGYLPSDGGPSRIAWYPWVYAAKVAIVAGLAWYCRSTWRDFLPLPGVAKLGVAALLGLAITAVWVGIDGLYPDLPFLGKRTAYDLKILTPPSRAAFITVRMIGLVVLVPVIEELFWRSFLMRWLIDSDFVKVPIGQVTPLAAAITSACFASAHPEWLPALLTGLAWAWLLWWSKSLSACLVSHVVANLALGIYVIVTGDWKFW
ncbi:CAAX prenyl protease-related protein [Singulisphaera sp. PoT]|uniref:CAAX prenyl protease-related protein n=1 Tax=Singulisphaera sp. PoT TaxID=3411797 RepID=UPI003BF49B24